MAKSSIEWTLVEADLKRYPHFDALMSVDAAIQLATSPARVVKHKFFPFMLYEQRWKRFRESGATTKIKTRPIRYAARADAYIYSYYRHLLSKLYEIELHQSRIDESVIAYRRVIDKQSGSGKSNIELSKDAFLAIRTLGNCFVIALDISSYFESINHSVLKKNWTRLLDTDRLPLDHFAVFKNITSYSVVDKSDVYERLGHFGTKISSSGKAVPGYITPFRDMPKRLCSGNVFREKIAGGDGSKSLIQKNFRNYGIPQGSPISDLLANIYMIDFDKHLHKIVSNLGGFYWRYSDDILIVIPGDHDTVCMMQNIVRHQIRNLGLSMHIKDEKTQIFKYYLTEAGQEFKLISHGKGQSGLEYLGFRYDGKKVYLRNSTVSNLQRKIASAAKRAARVHHEKYPGYTKHDLKTSFNYEAFEKRFSKVEDWYEIRDDKNKWTFWSYAKRAANSFGSLGPSILRQLKNLRAMTKNAYI